MLGTIDQGALQAAASDEGFLARLNRVSNDFDAYQKSESTWFRKHHVRQYLNEAGWQQEEYRDNDFHNLPLTLERGRDARSK